MWTFGSALTRRLDRLSEARFAAVVFLPGALVVLFVALPPILAVLGMSLFRIELLKDDLVPFVGLRNYFRFGEDEALLASIPRTVLFALGATLSPCPWQWPRR